MADLELRVSQQQVVDFFSDTAVRLAAEDSPLREGSSGHWNFYLTAALGPMGYSESVLTAIKRTRSGGTLPKYPEDGELLPPYEKLATELGDICGSEVELFHNMMADIISGKDVSDRAVQLFQLYGKFMQAAQRIQEVYDSQEQQPHRATVLVDGIKKWIKGKEEMYNPQTQQAYLARFL